MRLTERKPSNAIRSTGRLTSRSPRSRSGRGPSGATGDRSTEGRVQTAIRHAPRPRRHVLRHAQSYELRRVRASAGRRAVGPVRRDHVIVRHQGRASHGRQRRCIRTRAPAGCERVSSRASATCAPNPSICTRCTGPTPRTPPERPRACSRRSCARERCGTASACQLRRQAWTSSPGRAGGDASADRTHVPARHRGAAPCPTRPSTTSACSSTARSPTGCSSGRVTTETKFPADDWRSHSSTSRGCRSGRTCT